MVIGVRSTKKWSSIPLSNLKISKSELELVRDETIGSTARCPSRSSSSSIFISLLLVIIVFLGLFLFPASLLSPSAAPRIKRQPPHLPLRFQQEDGTFKILQVADLHFGNGLVTRCRDVLPSQASSCSDLNSTRFLYRIIQAEKPNLIVFTGDNIFGSSCSDAAESLFRAFRPVIESGIPWAAILGNHDQESTMTREELMSLISLMDYSVSQVNPGGGGGPGPGAIITIDGFGNYDLTVKGAFGSELPNTSVLNLYFLDTGDRDVFNGRPTYGWIRESQLAWLRTTSQGLQAVSVAPALAFFHIPIPEVRDLWFKEYIGQYQEAVTFSSVNSGVLKTLVSMADVKAVFHGHDHLNDFCGEIDGIWFCYGGGFGYHGYGRASWNRRARVVLAKLRRGKNEWSGVETIRTWKRLDDENLSKIDDQVLWNHSEFQFG